ncbi:MAG: NADH-quinone oxidoreductase subunit J [Alphaproteobacteria bacterium]|nr:NADH-quinone oxidoreductase subunit J [Alphaproteobacteria bacterium]MBF0354066.1 NADH-quinone oxidoreductase subunit J [Alphaproteobacteria bacterium]
MIQAAVFYMFAILAVLGGVAVISARNPVHSVLFLIFVFFNAAGLFLLLGAEFLAMVLVVVYVGAVAVLFLFVVMMLDINFVELRQGFLTYLPVGAAIGLVLLVELASVFAGWHVAPEAKDVIAAATPDLMQVTNTEALGQVIYTKYVYLFQASGMILLVAMVGAIMLTLRKRPQTKRQSVAAQLARKKEDTLEIRKVGVGGGIG